MCIEIRSKESIGSAQREIPLGHHAAAIMYAHPPSFLLFEWLGEGNSHLLWLKNGRAVLKVIRVPARITTLRGRSPDRGAIFHTIHLKLKRCDKGAEKRLYRARFRGTSTIAMRYSPRKAVDKGYSGPPTRIEPKEPSPTTPSTHSPQPINSTTPHKSHLF